MKKWLSIPIVVVLLIILAFFAGMFSFVSEQTITGPTQEVCQSKVQSTIFERNDPEFTCENTCSIRTPKLTNEDPLTFTLYPTFSLYDSATSTQYFQAATGGIASRDVYIPTTQGPGIYRVEYASTCSINPEAEDLQAKKACGQQQSDGTWSVDTLGSISRDYDGYDVYYLGSQDTFTADLVDDCSSNEVCHQAGTNAYCKTKTAPTIEYFCSNSLVIKNTDGFHEAVDDCRQEGLYCESGKSTCQGGTTTQPDGEDTSQPPSGTQYTDTGSDNGQFVDTGSDELPWYKKFWNWFIGLFTF